MVFAYKNYEPKTWFNSQPNDDLSYIEGLRTPGEMEDYERAMRYKLGGGNSGNFRGDFLGAPMSFRKPGEYLKSPGALFDDTLAMAKYDIMGGVETWLPENWDVNGTGAALANQRRYVDKLKAAGMGADDIAKDLARKSTQAALKPGKGQIARSVAGQATGKLANTAFSVVLPAMEFKYDVDNGINPFEAGVRAGLGGLASYGGGVLGGSLGLPGGPVGSIAGAVALSSAGNWLADKAADFVFGDEDKRIAEYQQKKAQQQQKRLQAQYFASNDYQATPTGQAEMAYLAGKYLEPLPSYGQSAVSNPWGNNLWGDNPWGGY